MVAWSLRPLCRFTFAYQAMDGASIEISQTVERYGDERNQTNLTFLVDLPEREAARRLKRQRTGWNRWHYLPPECPPRGSQNFGRRATANQSADGATVARRKSGTRFSDLLCNSFAGARLNSRTVLALSHLWRSSCRYWTLTLVFLAPICAPLEPMFRAMMRLSRTGRLDVATLRSASSPLIVFCGRLEEYADGDTFPRGAGFLKAAMRRYEKQLGDWDVAVDRQRKHQCVAVTEGSVFQRHIAAGDRVTSIGPGHSSLITNLSNASLRKSVIRSR